MPETIDTILSTIFTSNREIDELDTIREARGKGILGEFPNQLIARETPRSSEPSTFPIGPTVIDSPSDIAENPKGNKILLDLRDQDVSDPPKLILPEDIRGNLKDKG